MNKESWKLIAECQPLTTIHKLIFSIVGIPDFPTSFKESPLTIQFETKMSKKEYKKIKKEAKEIMKNKKHKIEIPEGYELYADHKTDYKSTLGLKIIEHTVILSPIKKHLPKTWEEYLRQSDKCYPTINHIRIPLEYNEVFKALAQLIELRDRYNDGWEPDWESLKDDKYCIFNRADTIMNITAGAICHVLAFRSADIRDTFLYNFADLIETAKSLL